MVEKLVKSKPIFIVSAFKFLTFEKDDLKTQCLKLNGGMVVIVRSEEAEENRFVTAMSF